MTEDEQKLVCLSKDDKVQQRQSRFLDHARIRSRNLPPFSHS